MSTELQTELKKTQAALERHQKFAENLRSAQLEFVGLDKIASARCACCRAKITHVSSYPFYQSPQFARQLVVWCSRCGFGAVPETSFSLQHYYEEVYAIENRGDRSIDPAKYFSKAMAENPPPNLVRYFNRARDQLARIKGYVPEIGAMLDVGSGPGYGLYLSDAKVKHALEFDRNSNKYLDYIGAHAVTWDSVPQNTYDVVLMSHVMEHFLPDDLEPRLKLAWDALKPGGLLYIEVPPGGMGWKNYIYKHEPHTLFFTPQSLVALGRRLGFPILFSGPVAKTLAKVAPRDNPIYKPPSGPHANPRGRLTLICQKAAAEAAAAT